MSIKRLPRRLQLLAMTLIMIGIFLTKVDASRRALGVCGLVWWRVLPEDLTFDPQHKDRVYLTSDVAGIWRSDDLGEHWYFITKGLGHLTISQVAIAPSDSNVLYAATNGGVYISTNAGGTLWTSTADTSNKGS